MKTKVIFLVSLLSTLFTVCFAQMQDDSVKELTTVKIADSVVKDSNPVSFGYHPGNYKHPAKAKQSKQLFRVRGGVNRRAVITNYKRRTKITDIVDKTIVTEQTAPKKSRNYKRPYSNN